MEETIDNLINAIEEFLKIDQASVDWETRPSVNKWSKKEIIGHLIDSAQVNLERFIRCTYEENFKLIYEQDEWVAAAHYQETDVKEILDLWILLNRQILRVLTNYPVDRLSAKSDTGKKSIALHTVEWLAEDYVGHMQQHLAQII